MSNVQVVGKSGFKKRHIAKQMMTMRDRRYKVRWSIPLKNGVALQRLRSGRYITQKNLLIQVGLQIRIPSRLMQVIDCITSGRKEKIDIKGVNAESV